MQIQKNDDDSTKRIKSEFNHLYQNPFSGIGIPLGIPDPENIYIWRITLLAPKDTSYRGGLFFLKILFPEDFPQHAPEVCFKTPIYHVNVNPKKSYFKGAESLGHVCISTLNWWKPEYKMGEVLTNLFALFYMANPDSPYGLDRADELRFNKALYEEKIKYFTKKYANARYDDNDKEYDHDWDFSYGKLQ